MSSIASLVPVGGGSSRVRVQVPLSRATAPDVRDELASLIRSGEGPILLDMSASGVLDPAGMATLVAAHVRAAEHGRRLRVVGVDERTRRLLLRAGRRRIILEQTAVERPVVPARRRAAAG